MKAFKIIFAALAATAALAGCTKEIIPPNFENDKVAPAAEGTRVITVSFAPQTKTTLEEGLQPRFANGDSILLFTVPEDENETLLTDIRKVKVDGSGNATISTNLTGTLKAFYPASAAVVKNNIVIGEISAIQSGKFADANIAGADIDENNSAQFENVAPLLIITPPSGTKKLIVRSLRTIGEGGQRSEMASPINTSAEEKEQCTVTVLNPDSDGNYYVAFYYDYDVKLSDLSFEALFDASGTTGSIKGIPASKIAQQAAATGIENYEIIKPGIAYTIDANNWHEYVTIAGRKWATMNVGAETPEGYGDYFAYGEVVGHKAVTGGVTSDEIDNAFSADFDSFDFSDATRYTGTCDTTAGFAQCNSPYYDGTDYSTGKYNISTGKQVLDLADDGANANWGGAWRMPTKDEMTSLTQVTATESESPMGITIGTGENKMFIPLAGCGIDNTLLLYAVYLSSSSLSVEENKNEGYSYAFIYADPSQRGVLPVKRYGGLPIRAIIDEPKEEIQSDDENENYKHESTTDWFDD